MAGVATHRAVQDLQRLAVVHAAARAVRERDDAVDVREVRERVLAGEGVRLEDLGDVVRHRRRAVHRGEDADVVARAHAAIGAVVAHEGRRRVRELRGPGEGAVRVVAREVAHDAVVRVHVVAGLDRAAREADDLPVAMHGLAVADRLRRDLVADGDAHLRRDALVGQPGAGQQVGARDDDVVGGVEADRELGERHRRFSVRALSFGAEYTARPPRLSGRAARR